MAVFIVIAALVLLLAVWPRSRAVLRATEEECHSLLDAWAEENGLTLLRYRPCWWDPRFDPDLMPSIIYQVSVADSQGHLRSGWACIFGRMTGYLEFTPRTVEMSLGRARNAPRSAKAAWRNEVKLLWDAELDG